MKPHTLRIEGELTIYRAAELRGQLLASLSAMTRGDALQIDLAAVTEMDSAGVQVLMAAKKSAQAAGAELRLAEHSPAVLDVFETLDLAAHFGDALLLTPAPKH